MVNAFNAALPPLAPASIAVSLPLRASMWQPGAPVLQNGGAMFTSTRSMVTIGDRATLVGNTAKSVRGIHPFSRAAGRPEHAWNSGPALGPLNIPYYCNSKHI